jgi:hypothetical protein
VAPVASGAHSATLELLDSSTGVPVFWTAFTVIAAELLTAQNPMPFAVDKTVDREIARSGHHFIQIPEGTQLLRMEVKSQTGKLDLVANPPLEVDTGGNSGDQYSALERLQGRLENYYSPDFAKTAQPQSRTYFAPVPKHGVWEFIVRDRSGWQVEQEPFDPRYTFRATALAANLRATVAPNHAIQVDIKNRMGPLDNGRLRLETGVHWRTMLDAHHALEMIEVPDKTSSLWLRAVSDKTHRPVRLWIYCDSTLQKHGPTLVEVPFDARQSVTVRGPTPGTWRIVADEADMKEGPVDVEIAETSPQYGEVVQGRAAPRRSGESWSESLTLAPSASKPGTRSEVVLVELVERAAEDGANAGATVQEPPQRPFAIGQTLVELN